MLGCESANRRLQQYADTAVFSHDVHAVRRIDGVTDEVFERETIVLRRCGSTWTRVHEHLSPDPSPVRAAVTAPPS